MVDYATSLYRSADILSASAHGSALSFCAKMFQMMFALRAQADRMSALLRSYGIGVVSR